MHGTVRLVTRYAASDFKDGVFVRAHLSHDTAEAIYEWAKTLTLPEGVSLVDPNEYHTTLIYSKTPFDYSHDTHDSIYPTADATNKRLEVLGKPEDAKVLTLRFDSHDLTIRHNSLKDQGGVSDFPAYKPHITIAKNVPEDHDASQHDVFNGPLVFTSESAEPIEPDRQKDFDESEHPRDEHGRWTDAGGDDEPAPSESKLDPKTVADFADATKEKYGLDTLSLYISQNTGYLRLDYIIIPKEKQRQGLGTKAMDDIVAFADEHDMPMSLSTAQRDPHHGTTSSSRLKKFYKRFGFVENKGRNYHPEISDNMIRPRKSERKKYWDESQHPRVPAGSPGGGQFGEGGGGGAEAITFVSPSTSSLSFHQAVAALDSPQQKALRTASGVIDLKLGIESSNRNAIGAWADGAENSIMVTAHGATPAQMRAASAMKGYIADQKQVLIFTPDRKAGQYLANFDTATNNLGELHDHLLKAGLAHHTLEPLAAGGVRVHVFGEGQETLDAIGKAAKDYDATFKLSPGSGEFLGTQLQSGSDREQRDDARRVYEDTIREIAAAGELHGGRDAGKIWDDVRDYWRTHAAEAPGEDAGGAGGGEAGRGGARSADEAQRGAAQAASGYAHLDGLPNKPIKVGDQYYVPGPIGKVKAAAEAYMRSAGLPYAPPKTYQKVDPGRATRIADAYEAMEHAPDDPAVKASYDALAKEVLAQWQFVKATGLKVEWIQPGQDDPYKTSLRMAAMDVIHNNHLWAFPTDLGFGSGTAGAEAAKHDNPMLQPTTETVGGRALLVNDVFRIVHDYFGHFADGVGFRADGEDNAWRDHAAMFSAAALPALTTETRGQNSWLNFGPYGEHNKHASPTDTVYAPQKIGLLPEWAWTEGRRDKSWAELFREWLHVRAGDFDESKHPRDEHGRWSEGGGGDEPSGGGHTDERGDWSLDQEPELNKNNMSARSLQEAADRGVFEFKLGRVRSGYGDETQEVHVKPDDVPAHWGVAEKDSGRRSYYDPELAEKYKLYEGDPGWSTKPKDVSIGAFDVKSEPGHIYRGMSYEEYQDALQRGYFESKGGFNLGEAQHGLTYFSTDPQQASSYANGFAPWMYKATPSRPAVIVDVTDPGNHVDVPGLGRTSTEVGIRGRLPTSSIQRVWLGKPHIVDEGTFDVIRDKYRGTSIGGGASYSASVHWEEQKQKAEKDWDESKHPRDPAGVSTGGQFTGGGGGGESEGEESAELKLDPKVVQVGGDEWNKATARKLEREYQAARPLLDSLTKDAVKLSAAMTGGKATPPVNYSDLSAEDQDAVYAKWKEENKDHFKTDVEAAEAWDAMSEAGKSQVAKDQGVALDEEDEEDQPYYPESWDALSDSKQQEIEDDYVNEMTPKFLEDETTHWYDSGGALDDAKNMVAWEFTKGQDLEWAQDAIEEVQKEREEAGETPLPFEFPNEYLDNMTIEYSGDGEGGEDPDIKFDDKGLDEEHVPGLDPAQQQLPGIPAPTPSERLTEEMRDQLVKALTEAFNKRAEDRAGNMEPPEYLSESASEYAGQYFGEMSDKQKFNWAYENDKVDKPESETKDAPPENKLLVEALPWKFDPLNETSGVDYTRTQRLARFLSVARANEIIVERGLRKTSVDPGRMAAIDHTLWDAWKGSSTSDNGKLLQVATADELGGRLNTKTGTHINVDDMKTFADHRYADIGGYAGVKAYIRAKWETTQYLLDRAGQQELELYRGIDLKRYDPERYAQALREKGVKQYVADPKGKNYEKAPTIKVDRNGAASATTDPSIANGWKGAGGVVLRAHVPRTAAISVPAYGINIHSEHEVVIAGTAWKSWDAWLGRAPTFDAIPIGANGTGIGTNAPKIAVAA